MTRPKEPPEEMEDIDPGLARERTELAWTRTAISFAALGAAILKTAPTIGVPVLGMSALVWGLGRLPRRGGGAGNERRRLLLVITVVVTLVSLAALAVTLAGGKSPVPPR